MGCILFELATGTKPFYSDIAVLEYSGGRSEIKAVCHANIVPDMAKKISDAMLKMFDLLSENRPKSDALAKVFNEHYHSANEQEVLEIRDSGSMDTMADSLPPIGAIQHGIN